MSSVAADQPCSICDQSKAYGIAAVRECPESYVGSTGTPGLHHLLWELVDNAVSEALNGHATRVTVRLRNDGSAEVTDNGRGIPLAIRHDARRPSTLDGVMTRVHSVGRHREHLVANIGGHPWGGAAVVNALSTRMEVTVRGREHRWTQTYDRAIPGTIRRTGHADAIGTMIRFWPDSHIFKTTTYDAEIIARRLRELAFLARGATMELHDERDSGRASTPASRHDASGAEPHVRLRTFCFHGGLEDLLGELAAGEPLHRNPIIFESRQSRPAIQVALQWNTGHASRMESFVGTIRTFEGGSHEDGLLRALTSVISTYARKYDRAEYGAPDLSAADVSRGLTAIISVFNTQTFFTGANSTQFIDPRVGVFVRRRCEEALTAWFTHHPQEARTIVEYLTGAEQ